MMMLLSWAETQLYVHREKSLELRQQPCRAPVLTVSSANNYFLILITCRLSVRKSSAQKWVGVGTPRSASFTVIFIGLIILKVVIQEACRV